MPFDPYNLSTYPELPGVYLMRNSAREVLYIGKAKNLKLRIKQYFGKVSDERAMIPILVPQIEEVETIVVPTEKEALILENNLIKKYKPKFNALLKDDKTFVSLMINHKHPWPTLRLVRYKGKPELEGLYFGPYSSAEAARSVYELIFSLFPLRQCTDEELKRRKRPCLLYSIKKCCAPCVQYCSQEEYQNYIKGAKAFLKGEEKNILKELKEKMHKAADELHFETAAQILKMIRQIEHVMLSSSTIVQGAKKDYDVLGICRSHNLASIVLLYFREGKLLGSEQETFQEIAQNDSDLITSYLLQHYQRREDPPKEILLPLTLEEKDSIKAILQDHFKKPIDLFSGDTKERKALLELAFDNARSLFLQTSKEEKIQEALLYDLQETFRLSRFPYRIECFDNSNLSGSDVVSAMVVFIDGKKQKEHKRLFAIKNSTASDDLAAMKEVLHRRLVRGKEASILPDLILIDGGKNHLEVAIQVLKELEIVSVDLLAISKEKARHDKGMTKEKFYTLSIKDPISLAPTSPLLFFLQEIRDETHLAAIGFHKKKRSKRVVATALASIEGIGPIKSKRLLQTFGSLKKIAEANDEELLQVKGITKKDLEQLRESFKKGNKAPPE